ncbi:hypothetical protein EVG20_g451 [Dentipellis fragilis]|uniref:NADP-dependent oxidoreductase domain-containing protein n=1 Tax=Dentipellis fragilis TaxID=205917 RepID=A0A4Y9ZFB8_9AGAM|nr:hypothetical protein EVG20_g451 [Dentipellis fragilis]
MVQERACVITNDDTLPETLTQRNIMSICDPTELADLGIILHAIEIADKADDNTITLRKDWDATFELQCWTLVPVKDVLVRIVLQLLECKSTGVNRYWHEICDPLITYHYRLVPFKLGKHIIVRRGSETHPAILYHPPHYSHFPNFTLPMLHPYWVVLSAWTTFRANVKILKPEHVETYGMLKTIVDLWHDLAGVPWEGVEPAQPSTAEELKVPVGTDNRPQPSKSGPGASVPGKRAAGDVAQPESRRIHMHQDPQVCDVSVRPHDTRNICVKISGTLFPNVLDALLLLYYFSTPAPPIVFTMVRVYACLITNESAVPEAIADCFITDICDPDEVNLGDACGIYDIRVKCVENSIKLRRDWIATFEQRCWTLIPVKDTLVDILTKLLECKNMKINRPWGVICSHKHAYRYQLVSFRLGNLTIISQNPEPPHTTSYPAPYTKFPELTHRGLHPYWAIISAWTAFRANEKVLRPHDIEIYGLLNTIVDLWYHLSKLPWEELEDKEQAQTSVMKKEVSPAETSEHELSAGSDEPAAVDEAQPEPPKKKRKSEGHVRSSNKKRAREPEEATYQAIAMCWLSIRVWPLWLYGSLRASQWLCFRKAINASRGDIRIQIAMVEDSRRQVKETQKEVAGMAQQDYHHVEAVCVVTGLYEFSMPGYVAHTDLRGGTIDTKILPLKPGDHSPEKFCATLDASLKALAPHKIRIFYLHAPDRGVPYIDTVRAINELYKEGKLYRGVWTEQLSGLGGDRYNPPLQAERLRSTHGLPRNSRAYNAISRAIEPELIPAVRKFGLRLVTYSPLAGGFFTGRVSFDEKNLDPSGPFHPGNGWLRPAYRAKYLKNGQIEALKIVRDIAEKHQLTFAEIGYRWLQHHSLLQPGDGIIFGASTAEHVQQNIANAEKGPLPDDIVAVWDLANKVVGLDTPLVRLSPGSLFLNKDQLSHLLTTRHLYEDVQVT